MEKPMTKEITISTRVTEELAEKMDRLSEQLGRTRAWVLHEALQVYIASELEFIDAVQDGLNDLAQGYVVDHDEVVADWSRRRNGVKR
jgi:predicted transcriptional regulator